MSLMTAGQRRAISGAPKTPPPPPVVPESTAPVTQFVDIELLRNTYPSEFLEYCDGILQQRPMPDQGFFEKLGHYDVYDYEYQILCEKGWEPFLKLFWIPNIFVLDYFIKNRDTFINHKILDYGCGRGFLTIFLNAIGFDCYAYEYTEHARELPKYYLQQFGLQDKLLPLDKCQGIPVYISMGTPTVGEVDVTKSSWVLTNHQTRFKEYLRGFSHIDRYAIKFDYVTLALDVWRKNDNNEQV